MAYASSSRSLTRLLGTGMLLALAASLSVAADDPPQQAAPASTPTAVPGSLAAASAGLRLQPTEETASGALVITNQNLKASGAGAAVSQGATVVAAPGPGPSASQATAPAAPTMVNDLAAQLLEQQARVDDLTTRLALAPGRTILGVGTGFTGRNTMGMPPLPVATMVDYVRQVRGLLAGEDVLYREGRYERWSRLLSRDRRVGCINLDDPIPIHIAANAPKALAAVGEAGDGWITVAQDPAGVGAGLAAVDAAARRHGRSFGGPGGKAYTTLLTTGCIRADGEALDAPRVVRRVGPVTVVGVHAIWESARGGHGFGIEDPATAAAFDRYIESVIREKRDWPPGTHRSCAVVPGRRLRFRQIRARSSAHSGAPKLGTGIDALLNSLRMGAYSSAMALIPCR